VATDGLLTEGEISHTRTKTSALFDGFDDGWFISNLGVAQKSTNHIIHIALVYFPFLTQSSTLFLTSPTFSSSMATPIFECAMPVCTKLLTPSLTLVCVSATTGNRSSYFQTKSPTLPVVIGMTAQAVPIATANGTVQRTRKFRLRTRILEPIAAIST
jgi:hypothetical protein